MPFLLAIPLLLMMAAAGSAPSSDDSSAVVRSADTGGNRLEPLAEVAEQGQSACMAKDGTANDWCAVIVPGDEGLPQFQVITGSTVQEMALPALPDPGGFDASSRSVWPGRVVLGGGKGVLAGVLTEERTMYSGGGAHRAQLTLYRFAPGQPAREVLSVPWRAGTMIRACFSERDMRQRAGACHDEYAFAATLAVVPGAVVPGAVVPGGSAGAPVLRYATRATSYPGKVSRSADSLAAKPLRRRDLVTAVDADCSFTRDFRLDPASGTWRPDSPLPDCDDFTGL